MDNQNSPLHQTLAFAEAMEPYVGDVFKLCFPGCKQERTETGEVTDDLPLYEFAGIDGFVRFPEDVGGFLTYQTKTMRHHNLVRYGLEFTQEKKNGDGSLGEWYFIAADVYFYGYATEAEDGLAVWYIMDIPMYKLLVLKADGLGGIGMFKDNWQFGSARFFKIDFRKIHAAVMFASANIYDDAEGVDEDGTLTFDDTRQIWVRPGLEL